jgi:hypothetical protein
MSPLRALKMSALFITNTAHSLSRDIGYILVPGNSDSKGQHMDSITKSIKKAITIVNNKNFKGWIMDLSPQLTSLMQLDQMTAMSTIGRKKSIIIGELSAG